MRNQRKNNFIILLALIVLLVFLSGCSSDIVKQYIKIEELQKGMFDIVATGGLLMFTIQGIRWMASTTPEQRADNKKSMIYIILTLNIAVGASKLVEALYCSSCNCCKL